MLSLAAAAIQSVHWRSSSSGAKPSTGHDGMPRIHCRCYSAYYINTV